MHFTLPCPAFRHMPFCLFCFVFFLVSPSITFKCLHLSTKRVPHGFMPSAENLGVVGASYVLAFKAGRDESGI